MGGEVIRGAVLTAVAIVLANPAMAATKTRDQKVAEAKASLEEMSDEAAISFWNSRRDLFDKYGISMDYNRRFGRWLGAAFSLGMCENYVKPTLLADWMGKMDGFSTVLGEGFIEIRRSIEAAGNKLRVDGRAMSADKELEPAAAARFCDVELEAVRQLIGGI